MAMYGRIGEYDEIEEWTQYVERMDHYFEVNDIEDKAHTHTHTDRLTHRHTHTGRQTQTHTQTHTDTHRHTRTHRHTHTHSLDAIN